jgi:phage terminase large subunit
MTTLKIELAQKLIPVLGPELGSLRYRVLRGGRGSGKSFSVAKMSAIWGATRSIRILCTREFQNSIKQSFYAEVANAIQSDPWLVTQYDVGRDFIRHKSNGTEYLFAGLRHNIDSIKSMAQIDLCIVEEAEQVPSTSWQSLIPTIRAPGSEIIIIYNPKRRDSWVAQQFDGDKMPPRTKIVTVNHDGNPWFGKELEEQRQYDMEVMDPALYRHIWEGAYYEQSDAQVFAGKYRSESFEPAADWDGPYFGVDWGFSQDETAGVKAWVHDGILYVEHELYEKRLELDATAPALMEALPGIESHVSRADNARPESISYVKRNGISRMVACEKGKGSVEDGIEFIRSFRHVVIHPRCHNTLKEFDLYSYKTDRLSGDILPTLIDANNHAIDALRYALEPIMKQRKSALTTKRLF